MEPDECGHVTKNASNGTDAASAGDLDLDFDLELFVVSFILTCLTVIGTAGNAMVIYVFSRKKDKLVSTFFILTLAFVDFVTCLVIVPYTIFMENVRFYVSFDIVCKFYQFLITSNIPFSALIMAAIAVDRYLCICHPFRRLITVARARFVVVAMATLAAAIGVCVSLMYGVYDYRPLCGSLEDQGATRGPPEARVEEGEGMEAFSYLPEVDDTRSSVPEVVVFKAESQVTKGRRYGLKNIGLCAPNEVLVGRRFQKTFQTLYAALYLLCFVTVVVLYVLIYRSVLERRARRELQKSAHLPLVPVDEDKSTVGRTHRHRSTSVFGRSLTTTTTTTELHSSEEEAPDSPPPRGGGHDYPRHRRGDEPSSPMPSQRAAVRLANLKTAGVLFVVTLVFIVTFLPAFLMAHELIPYNMTIFYMYFANNVANPVIYSFMNRNFREKMKWLICRR